MTLSAFDRRRFLRTALGGTALLGLPGVLAACGDDDGGGDPAPAAGDGGTTSTTAPLAALSYVAPFQMGVNFMGEMAARSAGFMAAEGIDFDVQFARTAPQALQQLAAGQTTVCGQAPLSAVRAISLEGAPFRMIAMTLQRTLYRLVTTDEAPITRLQDLRGKTVGFPQLGSNAEETFLLMIRAVGVDPADVSRVAVGNDAAAFSFVEQGRIDCIFATIDAASTMRLQGVDPHVSDIVDANPLLGSGVLTTEETIQERHDDLVKYLRGLRASFLALRDPNRRAELISAARPDWDLPALQNINQSAAIIGAVSDLWFVHGEQGVLRNDEQDWEIGIPQFEQLGIARAGSDPTDFYTNELVDEAIS